MSLSNRYKLKYNLEGGMRREFIQKYKQEIEQIYKMVQEMFVGNPVILSGSAAILYYLINLGYDDLIEDMIEPSDLDLLLIDSTKNALLYNHFIGDFKKTTEIPTRSATFVNSWTTNKFKSFDLSIEPSSKYNLVGNILLININLLLENYEDNLIPEIRCRDYLKIAIIKKIKERLESEPRPDIIIPQTSTVKQASKTSEGVQRRRYPIEFSSELTFESPPPTRVQRPRQSRPEQFDSPPSAFSFMSPPNQSQSQVSPQPSPQTPPATFNPMTPLAQTQHQAQGSPQTPPPKFNLGLF